MKILLIEDDSTARYAMQRAIQAASRLLLVASNGDQGLEMIRSELPDLVFLDLNMPSKDGLTVLKELQSHPLEGKWPEIIVVTANDSVDIAVECIRRGASDFLTKPYDVDHLRSIVARAEKRVELEERVSRLETQLESAPQLGDLVSANPAMIRLFDQIRKSAITTLPVLIRGESGTGKELVARELHRCSDRKQQPFIAVNTAAISESLIESELFGHIRGAFTGADKPREGVFRKAHGGTLFLDEIGDMPASVQTRLLRVLQEGVVTPVGSEEEVHVDVRVISATHQDLEQSISDKLFRSDLYYRLKGIELRLPSLRSRREDILLLAHRFLPQGYSWSESAVAAMLHYAWPGNVRELKQRVEGAIALSSDSLLSHSDLGLSEWAQGSFQSGGGASGDEVDRSLGGADFRVVEDRYFSGYFDIPLTEAKEKILERYEKAAIARAMDLENNNVSAAARRLGIHRQSLQQKLKTREHPKPLSGE